jgi:hypothetical protein
MIAALLALAEAIALTLLTLSQRLVNKNKGNGIELASVEWAANTCAGRCDSRRAS